MFEIFLTCKFFTWNFCNAKVSWSTLFWLQMYYEINGYVLYINSSTLVMKTVLTIKEATVLESKQYYEGIQSVIYVYIQYVKEYSE